MIARLGRFASIGVLATLVHVITALFGRGLLELSDLSANVLGWLAAFLVSYAGHQRLTFGVRANHAVHLPGFVVVSVSGLIASSALVAAVTSAGGSFALAMVFVGTFVPLGTYTVLRLAVFTDGPGAQIGIAPETGVAASAAMVMLIVFWGQPMDHDVIWYHVATRKWLGGAELYTDIIEVNPPLAFYLTIPVVYFADLTDLSDKAAQLILTAGLTFASLALTGRRLVATAMFSVRQRAIILAGIGFVLIVIPLRDIAQREHLFLLMFLPWLCETLVARSRISVSAALLAAVGMCLKPFFVVFPAAILIVLACRTRSLSPLFSPSAWIFALTGLAYIGAVAIWHPAYLSEIMPMAQVVYGAYGAPVTFVVSRIVTPLCVFGTVAAWSMSRSSAPAGASVFFVASVAGAISYTVQGTGFGYHAVPFLAFGAIGCVFSMLDARCRSFAIAGLALIAYESVGKGYYYDAASRHIAETIAGQGDIHSLLVVSTHVTVGPIAAVTAGAEWASGYPAQWLIPGALTARATTDCGTQPGDCAYIDQIIDRNRSDILNALSSKPDIVVFDNRAGYFTAPFEWTDFLSGGRAWDVFKDQYSKFHEDQRFSYWRSTLPSPESR